MGRVAPWEHWRFTALVEAARRVCWGPAWGENPDFWRAYVPYQQAGVPWYRTPMKG